MKRVRPVVLGLRDLIVRHHVTVGNGLTNGASIAATFDNVLILAQCLRDGDVNQDNSITPADALLAFQQFLGVAFPSLDACQLERANALDPGVSGITPADAFCIFQKFLSLPSCLDNVE